MRPTRVMTLVSAFIVALHSGVSARQSTGVETPGRMPDESCAPARPIVSANPSVTSSADRSRTSAVVAEFTLSGAGYDTTITYTDEANLVFCRDVSGVETWIRLAEQRTDRGDHGPHIDIDVCNVRGGGPFAMMDPRERPCTEAGTWDVWWHDGPDITFTSELDSAPCELQLALSGNTLEGRFSCRGLKTQDGEQTLDVLDGWFRCQLQPQARSEGPSHR